MKAVSLIGVLLLAKLLTVAGRDLPLSIWTPAALVWQDVAVGAVFAGVAAGAGWCLPVRTVYWTLVLWIAVNVPVARTLSSALTVPMLRATGGALSDSIALYATPLNIALMALVIGSAAVLPRLTPSTRTLTSLVLPLPLWRCPDRGPLRRWICAARNGTR
jgi:hypothetical protein